MGVGRNVEKKAWITCRPNAQLEFVTSLQLQLGFEGPPEPWACLGSSLPARLPKHRAVLTAVLDDTAWWVTGRCNNSKRQTLAPLCREEGKEMPFTCTLEEDMKSQSWPCYWRSNLSCPLAVKSAECILVVSSLLPTTGVKADVLHTPGLGFISAPYYCTGAPIGSPSLFIKALQRDGKIRQPVFTTEL